MSLLPATPLITLAKVTEWVGVPGQPFPATSNALILRMISMASAFATSYLQRPIAPQTFTEVYNGNGGYALPLRQRPVIQVRSLTVGVVPITARTAVGAFGFVADDASVYIDGGAYFYGYGISGFYRGIQNVSVTYDAGYQTSDTVVVATAIPAANLLRPWNSDRGVANATTGTAFTLVTTAPSAGQYQITTDNVGAATYNFNASDAGTAIVITYGFTPEDVVQALIELVGERYKSRNRIGENSQSINQQVTSFSQKDMNASVRTLLQPYKNVVPVQ